MSGIDEQDRDQSSFREEERIWEQHVADRIRADVYMYHGGESEARRFSRQLTAAFREYESLYEECLMDVLQSESLNLNRQQIEAIVLAVEGRLKFVSWSRRNSRWYRFKRWLRNVGNR